MRRAPSVIYPVGRCAFYGYLLAGLGMLSLLAFMAWCWPWMTAPALNPHTDQLMTAGAGALLWLIWAGLAWRTWARTPEGRLQWDAQGSALEGLRPGVWRWHEASGYLDAVPLTQVLRVWDGQNRLLLCLRQPNHKARWIWVEQAREPARWDDLRRALMASS